VPIQPLTDTELSFGWTQQAADTLKAAYRDLREAFERQGAELRAAQAALAARDETRPLDWRVRHHQTCRDEDCPGCKNCRQCGALTLAYGFEDHLCFNCRNPPSD
jgi:hypothetical protein